MPRNPDEIGALWKKTSAKGTVFLSGKINGQAVVIFANRDKKNDKQPDYRVLLSKRRAEEETQEPAPF
jgi:uncharacterized protein (DUF736 family)